MVQLITESQYKDLFHSSGRAKAEYYELACGEGYEVVEIKKNENYLGLEQIDDAICIKSHPKYADPNEKFPKIKSEYLSLCNPRPRYYLDPWITYRQHLAIELWYENPSVIERLHYYRLCDRIGQLLLHS